MRGGTRTSSADDHSYAMHRIPDLTVSAAGTMLTFAKAGPTRDAGAHRHRAAA